MSEGVEVPSGAVVHQRLLRRGRRALQHADPRQLLPRVGQSVGGFVLEARLGAGGFGTVFRARRGPYLYALKLLYLPHTGRWGQRELEVLLRVPLAGGLLSVKGHGYWPEDSPLFLYLVMPYVQGRRLFVWAWRTRPSARQVARLVLALARQLRAVHRAGVVHRDVKGDNVLVHEPTGQPVLVDFGVGTYPGAPALTGLRPPGTAHYRSPESLRFRLQCTFAFGERYRGSARDDLWALGVLLYALLTGAYPFDAKARDPDAEEAMLEALILHAHPVPPHERNGRVPRALSELSLRLLEKAPEARYASAQAVCEALEAVLEEAREEAAWEVALVEGPPEGGLLEEAREEPSPEAEPPEALASDGEPPEAPEPSPPPPAPALAPRRVRGVAWAGLAGGLGMLLGALLLAPGRAPLPPPGAPAAAGGDFSGQEVAPPWKGLEGEEGAVPPWGPTPAPVARATPSKDMRVKTSQDTPSPQKQTLKKKALSRTLKAAGVATCTALAGCPAAQVLPHPPSEPCPPGAVEAMEKLGLFHYAHHIKDGVFLGVRQGIDRIIVRPGPAILVMNEPPFLRLSGRLLLGEGRVYGRFTEGQLKSGESLPVCYELYDSNERKAGRPTEGDSGPDTARMAAGVDVRPVRRFE